MTIYWPEINFYWNFGRVYSICLVYVFLAVFVNLLYELPCIIREFLGAPRIWCKCCNIW